MPYVHGHGRRQRGEDHHLWKGGSYVHQSGYVMRYARGHPAADASGYMQEHRLVMEQQLGRRLGAAEFVHHVNGDKSDNRPENLVVMTKAEHNALHAGTRVYDSERMRAAGRKGAAARWGRTSAA